MIEQIKKHPFISLIGAVIAMIAAMGTLIDAPAKFCSIFPRHLESRHIDDRLSFIWTGVREKDVFKKIGAPIIEKIIEKEKMSIYVMENGFLGLGFGDDGLVSQFVIAVPKRGLENFKGYGLYHPDAYGDFNFGVDDMSEHGNISTLKVGVGAQTGYVNIEIDPPFIIRRGGFYHKIALKYFEVKIDGETVEFGDTILNSTIDSHINFCEPEDGCAPDDYARAVNLVLRTVPGWLHISLPGSESFEDGWLARLFFLAANTPVEKGGLMSGLCFSHMR